MEWEGVGWGDTFVLLEGKAVQVYVVKAINPQGHIAAWSAKN